MKTLIAPCLSLLLLASGASAKTLNVMATTSDLASIVKEIGKDRVSVAAVVVGGAAITGGRGTLVGTLIGVALLGTIGTALTFLGINPFWEKAIQGVIILAALVSDILLRKYEEQRELTR